MLVLTRKLMEKLYIGDEICVTVVRMEGSQVRLGIEAPRHIPVVRAELARREQPEGSEPVVVTPTAEAKVTATVSPTPKNRPIEHRSSAWNEPQGAPLSPRRQRPDRDAGNNDSGPAQDATRSDSRNR